jgi:hypothetical protein
MHLSELTEHNKGVREATDKYYSNHETGNLTKSKEVVG